MPATTLLDIAKANGRDAVVGLIEEAVKTHPELQMGSARTIKGRMYKTLVRVALGQTTGGFRAANTGVNATKSTYENRTVETFILEARMEADKAVADSSEDGPRGYLAMEASGVIEGEMQGLGKQFYYGNGTGGNANGFPGLMQGHDTANMVVDAGGTTANTGSSAWAVKFGPQDVRWVWGENGSLALTDVKVETLLDADNKKYTGYTSSLLAYPGLQIGSLRSVVRAKKLTEDAGKGMTDAILARMVYLMENSGNGRPDVILLAPRSRYQLQLSRTPVLQAGANGNVPGNVGAIAATPTEYEGIPILTSQSISTTESLTL